MKIYKVTICASLLLFWVTNSSLHAQEANSDDIQSCRTFAQSFYNWYVGKHFIDKIQS